MHREKERSSKHQTQNLDHEAKILLHSSIYRHETNYNGFVSQTKRYGHQWSHLQKSISTWSSRGGLALNLISYTGSFTSNCQPFENGCLLVYIGRRTDPLCLTSSNPRTYNLGMSCNIKTQLQAQ